MKRDAAVGKRDGRKSMKRERGWGRERGERLWEVVDKGDGGGEEGEERDGRK